MSNYTKEKICAFYASDYHFEMISLPYINQKIEEKEKIIILTQNDLEKSIKTLLENTNLKEEKKEEILKLNWKNKDTKEIKIKTEDKTTLFVKGKESYINHMNQDIEKIAPKKANIKIINCYEMEEIGEKLEEIMGKYHKILKTSGEKEIEK